jgi:hypothetical protein
MNTFGSQEISRFRACLELERFNSPGLNETQLTNEVIKNMAIDPAHYSKTLRHLEDVDRYQYQEWKDNVRAPGEVCGSCSNCIMALSVDVREKTGYCRLNHGKPVSLNSSCPSYRK